MIAWKYKLWRGASVAAIAGVAACSPSAPPEQAPPVASTPPAVTSGEAGIGEGGGEGGLASAYAGLAGDQLLAIRLQQLRGYVLVAERLAQTGRAADAGALVQQGLTEVIDPAAGQLGTFDASAVRAAAASTDARKLQAAQASIDGALRGLSSNHADVAVRLVDVATMIYQTIEKAGSVDTVGYQRSMGAVLAARDALAADAANLRRTDSRAVDEGVAELDRMAALYPGPTPAAQPASYRQVLAQSSRVRLALSPLL